MRDSVAFPLVYLASPYTHASAAVMEYRFRAVCRVAGRLVAEGLIIYCPIAHSHPLCVHGCPDLQVDGKFWARLDDVYVSLSHRFIVLRLRGWQESRGVDHEIKLARSLGMEIEYLDP